MVVRVAVIVVVVVRPGRDARRGRGRRRGVVVAVCPGELAAGVDLEIDAGDPAARDRRDLQALAPRADLVERQRDDLERDAEIEQRAEHHVAGGAAGAVDVEVEAPHARTASRAIRTAAMAAPTPLSMLTTVMPGEHELAIAASATSPSIETP